MAATRSETVPRTSAEAVSDREIVITRSFQAPPRLVFQAYTTPEHLKRWFGPKEWPLTLCEVDFRIGGRFRFALTGPDRRQGPPFGGEYLDIVPHERIQYDNGFEMPGAEKMIVTITLQEQGGTTVLTMRTLFSTVAARNEHLQLGFAQGVGSGFDNLVAYLEELRRNDREVIITRTVDAPRALVFQVWTDPKHVDRWWGPNGFTNRTSSMDVRVGGQWRYTMTGPDGRVFPNLITYREISPVDRLVYDHGDDTDPKQFEAFITFEERGDRTHITMRSIFPTAAARDRVVREFGAIEGGKQTLARLDAYVADLRKGAPRKAEIDLPSDLEIRVRRWFDAPRELVFDASTKPEHLVKWWGPRDHELVHCEVDLRVGGGYRFVLRGPNGMEVGFRGEYLELVRPERVKQTFIYEPYPDHGAVENCTLEEKDGGTLLTTVITHKSKEGRDGMFNAGMEGGMNESHARLDELLATLSR